MDNKGAAPMKPLPENTELTALLKKAAADFAAMTPDEQEAMLRMQREGYVRADLTWPRDCPYR
jgi:hypothetical protein